MRTATKIFGGVLAVVVLLVGGFYVWASITAGRLMGRTIEVHSVDFPVPFPLTAAERQAAGVTGEAAERLAAERALERGRHLMESRYGCTECHGVDLSGGVMVDDPMIGRLLGPNLTAGEGSRTVGYAPRDWDRIVRHGVRTDGAPSAMPAEDFQRMADQELSDLVFYISSFAPVDSHVPPVKLGPLGTVLLATGQLTLSTDEIASHHAPHEPYPPPPAVSVEFGRHIAAVCTGCHRQDLAGGKILGGEPSWVPAANLTPHPSGLGGWTYEQFTAAMRDGKLPEGGALQTPMTSVIPYAQRMTEVEMEALWTYLRSLPAVPARE